MSHGSHSGHGGHSHGGGGHESGGGGHSHFGVACSGDHGNQQNVVEEVVVNDIYTAASLGNLEMVRNFIEHDNIDVNQRKSDGTTALHWAAFKAQYNVVRYLVDKGAEIEVDSTEEKNTPLMWACIGGDLRVVHLLISKGADATKKRYTWL